MNLSLAPDGNCNIIKCFTRINISLYAFRKQEVQLSCGMRGNKRKKREKTLNTLPASEVETTSRCTTDLLQPRAKYVRQ